jgi:sugar phosphate isomerase/epimerase
MRISLSTVCMPWTDWRGALRLAAEAGFDAVELMMIPGWIHLSPGQVPPAELLRELERNQLRLVGVHAGGIDGTDDGKLADSLRYVRSVIGFAQELGGPLVNVNGMPVPPGTGPAQREAMRDRIIAGLRGLLPDLGRHGVRITLENHAHYQIETAEDYLAIFAAIPDQRIGATVDTGHCTASGVDIPELVRRLGRRVFHAHIKDHRGHQSVALGSGETDNAGAIRELRALGYPGHLSIELELGERDAGERAIRASLPYLRGLTHPSMMETR